MDNFDNFIKCFEETFGFNPPNCEEFQKKEEDVQQPLYKYVEYPENFYIPKNQYELSCQNISIWKKLRYTPYKRISHFREHLNRLQGCQFINIPEKVFQLVQETLKNHENETSTQLYYITKETLRKAKFSYYNEHIHHLISLVQKQYLKISYDDYRSLCRVFQEVESSFNQKKSATQSDFFKKRKNLISYYLVIQLLLYLFHYHPRYKLPTLYDVLKRKEYYVILLGLIQNSTFGLRLLEEHFRRKKNCKWCLSDQSNLVFDEELLKLI